VYVVPKPIVLHPLGGGVGAGAAPMHKDKNDRRIICFNINEVRISLIYKF